MCFYSVPAEKNQLIRFLAYHILNIRLISNCYFYNAMVLDQDKEKAKVILLEFWEKSRFFARDL